MTRVNPGAGAGPCRVLALFPEMQVILSFMTTISELEKRIGGYPHLRRGRESTPAPMSSALPHTRVSIAKAASLISAIPWK